MYETQKTLRKIGVIISVIGTIIATLGFLFGMGGEVSYYYLLDKETCFYLFVVGLLLYLIGLILMIWYSPERTGG